MNTFKKYHEDNAPQGSAATLTEVKTAYGFLPNLMGQMAQSPALLKAYKAVGELFSAGSLNATEQQVVLMTINRYHECRYCMSGHTMVSEMSGVDMDAINAIRDDQPINNQKYGELRHFTLKLVEQRGQVSQAQLNAFFKAGYNQETVLEVIVAAAYKTMRNYTNHVAGTEIDGAFLGHKWAPKSAR